MNIRLTLYDTSKTVHIWDYEGTIKYTLNAANPSELIPEDLIPPIILRVRDLVFNNITELEYTPETINGTTYVDNATATLSGRTITIDATPASEDDILCIRIKQTYILRKHWSANPSNLAEITFDSTVDVTQSPIEVVYQLKNK